MTFDYTKYLEHIMRWTISIDEKNNWKKIPNNALQVIYISYEHRLN